MKSTYLTLSGNDFKRAKIVQRTPIYPFIQICLLLSLPI